MTKHSVTILTGHLPKEFRPMPDLLPQRLALLVCSTLLLWASPPAPAQTAVPVAVAAVNTQPVSQEVNITGSVTSPQVARLSTATDGLVLALHADEGERMTAGQQMLSLDSELAEQRLAAARAQVKQAEVALADAHRRLREAESLGPKGGIPETQIEALRSEVAEDEAALARFRADAGLQQALLERHHLKAPFAGVVSRRLVEAGEWVTPGQGVFELVATEGLRLDFSVAEDFLPGVSTDTEISFRLGALPGRTFSGRVSAIVPVAETGARTFLLRVSPETPVAGMMPGLSAVATLRNPTRDTALAIPEDAILRYPDGRVVVWTLEGSGEDTVARERLVTTGAAFSGMVAISTGLDEGDLVVVRGNESLQDGQRVRVVPAGGG